MAKLNDDIGALFKLPLTQFVSARKALAARLKKTGFVSESEAVKALAKPSLSAWTVNQLYWRHRDAFDELIATGQRFRKAQVAGKMANMREALDARREALSELSDLATKVLRDAGHNPSLDTLRSVGTTLEALSVATSLSDGPTLGQLTADIDPPGFDSFASFPPSTATTKRTGAAHSRAKKEVAASREPQKTARDTGRQQARQARINSAKVLLQQAKKSLNDAQATVKSLEGAQKKAEAASKDAIKQKREAEERFRKASAASTDAALRAQSLSVELSTANKMLDDAKHAVASATKELEESFRASA